MITLLTFNLLTSYHPTLAKIMINKNIRFRSDDLIQQIIAEQYIVHIEFNRHKFLLRKDIRAVSSKFRDRYI